MKTLIFFLPYLHYLTVMSNHRVASLTIGGDSVVVNKVSETHRYKILESKEKGKYTWLYVQGTPAIQLIIYSRSEDKQDLYLLNEINQYPSIEACKKATDTLDPETKLFANWYSETTFKKYSTYPALSTIDSATTASLSANFETAMVAAAAKGRNTRVADLYFAGTAQDVLSKILIAHHLDPNATIPELSDKMQQFHIRQPHVPIHHTAPRSFTPH